MKEVIIVGNIKSMAKPGTSRNLEPLRESAQAQEPAQEAPVFKGLDRTNGVLDDICAEIGYTATTALVAWYGGANLYVPESVSELHQIAKVIGIKPFERLVAAYPKETLFIPDDVAHERDRRDRIIADMVAQGLGTKAMRERTGITERRAQQIRARLEAAGVLPLVRKGAAAGVAAHAQASLAHVGDA